MELTNTLNRWSGMNKCCVLSDIPSEHREEHLLIFQLIFLGGSEKVHSTIDSGPVPTQSNYVS